MDSKPEIVVVGSHAPALFLRVKRIPKPGETVIGWDFQEQKDGGKGSNQAIAAARLGARVGFVGCVGEDRIGYQGKAWLETDGVNIKYLEALSSKASGVGFIVLDEEGIPAIVTSKGANDNISTQLVDQALDDFDSAKVLLTQFEIPINIALYALQKARRKGMLSILNPAPAPEEPISEYDNVSILVPNEYEAKLLLGIDLHDEYPCRKLVHELRNKTKVECVIVTLGENGAVGEDRDGLWKVDAPKVSVVDTAGAGDAFCAALGVYMLKGMATREASKWACKIAGLSVTKAGTIPAFPTINEVQKYLLVLQNP